MHYSEVTLREPYTDIKGKMKIEKLLNQLIEPIERSNYVGWDVFDGLNSKLFKKTFIYKSRFFRLLWIQLFKKSPVNFRGLFFVKKGYNAKGLALFMQGFINLYKATNNIRYFNKGYNLAGILKKIRSKRSEYYCWGYNFDWESIAYYVPENKPNMIVSSFVAQAFLDLYEVDNNEEWLNIAIDVSKFIQTELLLYEKNDELCFGYIPNETPRVHNANLMGAKLFARLYSYTKDEKYKLLSKKSVNYTVNRQNNNGSWVYGQEKHWQWIDNFHTGFILMAIKEYEIYSKDYTYEKNIADGLKFHINNHYDEYFIPKYYNKKKNPLDIHNFAQGIITFLTFGDLEKAKKLARIAINTMWDNKKNYFYYQKTKLYTNKNNYIRWSQAWMFAALSKLLLYQIRNEDENLV